MRRRNIVIGLVSVAVAASAIVSGMVLSAGAVGADAVQDATFNSVIQDVGDETISCTWYANVEPDDQSGGRTTAHGGALETPDEVQAADGTVSPVREGTDAECEAVRADLESGAISPGTPEGSGD